MPSYQFKCDENHHVFEQQFSMQETRPEILECPECNEKARRYIGNAPPIRYNGTGWTRTEIPRSSSLEGYTS